MNVTHIKNYDDRISNHSSMSCSSVEFDERMDSTTFATTLSDDEVALGKFDEPTLAIIEARESSGVVVGIVVMTGLGCLTANELPPARGAEAKDVVCPTANELPPTRGAEAKD